PARGPSKAVGSNVTHLACGNVAKSLRFCSARLGEELRSASTRSPAPPLVRNAPESSPSAFSNSLQELSLRAAPAPLTTPVLRSGSYRPSTVAWWKAAAAPKL